MKRQMMTIALIGITMVAMAQQKLGVFGSVNASTTSAEQSKWGVGGNLGLAYNFDFSEHWGLQPRLVLGYQESRLKSVVPTDFYSQWNVAIPVLASYRFNLSNNLRLRLNAGLYVQWAAFGREKQLYTTGTGLGWWHADFGERTTYGLQFGPMLEFGKWFVTADYKHSFKDSKLNFGGKERTLQLGIGYSF